MQLQALDRFRERAAQRLNQMASAHGSDSPLYRKWRALCELTEEEAFTSLLHGDFENAMVVLDRGLHALEVGT